MKAWVFGDNVDTDVIAPGRYMKFGIDQIAQHCFEAVDPAFSRQVAQGDIIVAGRNFGCGSSREQAPAALKHLGIAALIAESFAGLFYRNALNLGLPALACSGAKRIRNGDRISIDYARNELFDITSDERMPFEPIPAHLMEMMRDGGLLPHLEKRLARKERGS
jgi:3-isopropylmalate/(R)-2-methylmalate dehydratase small subunit